MPPAAPPRLATIMIGQRTAAEDLLAGKPNMRLIGQAASGPPGENRRQIKGLKFRALNLYRNNAVRIPMAARGQLWP